MIQKAEKTARQRCERRISVRLPLRVRGRDARGFAFEEDTASEIEVGEKPTPEEIQKFLEMQK